MADYIYLLQNRLTPSQQTALQHVREAARQKGMTVFLVGGAVRDLTSGTQIRDLDVAIQGNAPKLKKDLQKEGFTLLGESELTQSAWYSYPGGVRLEVSSTLSVTWPKPGKPVYKPANILDDLRRRDFTANAMAISLNEGSFGLLMDPLNGVADIENRELRLVSNYGFIEDPVRMIRAQRLAARLGWHLEEKTEQRYQTGKAEDYIAAMSPAQAGYELEEIFHEEDPLRVLHRLEHEGWMKALFPAWNASKANEAELNKLRDHVGQLETMNIFPDPSAAFFAPLTAKLAPKDVAALKKMFVRPGLLDQITDLEPASKNFAAQFTGKSAATPSESWKLLYASMPEAILWLYHTSKSAPVQAKFKAFFNDWSQARQKIPYQLMQEMRITPEIKDYDSLIETLFFAIMDGKLDTPEAARAFLEPYSPPAPPPPVNLRRRAVKRETKASKSRAKKGAAETTEAIPETDLAEIAESENSASASELKPVETAPAKPAKATREAASPKPVAKVAPAKPEPLKKPVAAKAPAPAKKAAAKTPAKAASKAPAKKAPAKAASKTAPKKTVPAKKAPAVKKPAPKPAKKAVKKAAPAKKAPAKKPAKRH